MSDPTVEIEPEALFPAGDAWSRDPTDPDMCAPTPSEVVAGLSGHDRRQRVTNLIRQAQTIVSDALDHHLGGRTLVARCVLFSGGNDSTTLAHMFRQDVTHAVHANTTIGIEQTRQFVRDTCAAWDVPLLERVAPVPYRDLVIERGFPGPAMHFKMYARLKERCLEQVRRELVINPRRQRVLFLAGRRRSESSRRADIPVHERRGSVIWASPLAFWTTLDVMTYRRMFRVPENPVSALLHMSGECLCGSFAKPGELDEIGYWFPDVRQDILDLEAEVRAAGHPEALCRWGNGKGAPSQSGALCSSCDALF